METKLYGATLRIWSKPGVTPITKRGGSYCDELACLDVLVSGPENARARIIAEASKLPNAFDGHYHIPRLPNHNARTGYVCL